MKNDFLIIFCLKSPIILFSFLEFEFFFPIKPFFSISIWVCLYFSFVFLCFCHRLVIKCFVINLLRRVVMSSIVSFFMGFHVINSDNKVRSDRAIKSNHICQYGAHLES